MSNIPQLKITIDFSLLFPLSLPLSLMCVHVCTQIHIYVFKKFQMSSNVENCYIKILQATINWKEFKKYYE